MYKDGASEIGLDPEHSPQAFISEQGPAACFCSLLFLCNQSEKEVQTPRSQGSSKEDEGHAIDANCVDNRNIY